MTTKLSAKPRLCTLALLGRTLLVTTTALTAAPALGLGEATGTKIAFTRSDQQTGIASVWLMNEDGSGQSLLGEGGSPSWSPDGRRLAFVGQGQNGSDIWLMNVDGTGRVNLTNSSGTQDSDPAWSPDGKTILFVASGAAIINPTRSGEYALVTINTDGTGWKQLTSGLYPHCPSWSPNGEKILFSNGQYELMVMDANGTNTEVITIGACPAWSPDGTQIAFTEPPVTVARTEIYLANVDGSGPRRVTSETDGLKERDLAWSPDGTRIVSASSDDSGITIIAVTPVDGSARTTLTNGPYDFHPHWQPRKDTDGDALLDSWETVGLDTDGDGQVDLDLPAMGADPNHKDIFLEIDWMEGHRLGQAAIDRVVAAFAAAPVANPDGTTGITLHVDNGPNSTMDPVAGTTWGEMSKANVLQHQVVLGSFAAGGQYDWSEFDEIKKDHFSDARLPAFHYVVSGHRYGAADESSGGISRGIEASDLIVALAAASEPLEGSGTLEWQAGTLMHELGHNLGLKHGGGDHLNYKPNFLSIMNYAFPTGLRRTSSDAIETNVLDYSRFDFDVDESLMSEVYGFGFLPAARQAAYFTIFRCDETRIRAPLAAASFDLNCDDVVETGVTVLADLNADNSLGVLDGYVDWDNLIFDGGAVGDAAGTVALPRNTPIMEPPLEELLENARVLEGGAADTTAPVLRVPAGVTADATGPGGAVVSFIASASDDVDRDPRVSCVPASGSLFAIGDTRVTCTAEDVAGNEATSSFTVHVKGAGGQIADLVALVESYRLGKLGTSLRDKLVSVQRFLAAGKPRQAEENLASFISQVQAQRGNGLTAGQADELLTAARRISVVI